jgi:hypothetical protein
MNLAKRAVVGAVLAMAALAPAAAGEAPFRKLAPVPFTDVKFTDGFWAPRLETNRTRSIPYNFKMCEDTGRITNFDKAAGRMEGKFEGIFFNDSDVYKVLEGAAYALASHPDPALEKYVDGVIARIAAAQQSDGYLYTFYTVNKELDKRWTDCRSKHEMYCAGHLFEAAVAHWRATGKRTLLDVATRLADYIDSVFGPGKRRDVSGHEEIELALVKLYEATGQERYLKLAKFLLDERGNAEGHKLYGPYNQDHIPVIQQTEPVGHAVRAMYLYCGMSDVAAILGDAAYLKALNTIWDNVATKKMYLTGGVGARHAGEAFGDAYELPNDTAYCETCAAIGFALWNQRMFLLTGDARYVDVVERVIYNGFLSGVSLDGEKFFYVNPLASRGNHHRQPWFGCACCPVNVVRLVPSLPGYVYAQDAEGIYVNLYVGSTAKVKSKAGEVAIAQETRYPWDGRVKITVDPAPAAAFTLAIRIPDWCRPSSQPDGLYRMPGLAQEKPVTMKVNGKDLGKLELQKGYVRISRQWRGGDTVELDLPMPVRRVYTHPEVKADAGRVALQRGPVVYCFEAADNGKDLGSTYLPPDAPLAAEHRPDLLGGVTVIKTEGCVRQTGPASPKPAGLVAVPYYAWDHREAGPMMVWLAEKPDAAQAPPKPTIASTSRISASHMWGADTAQALSDQIEPKSSGDESIPRHTWWDHRGTKEWVQYDFARPAKVSSVEVYWFDDTGRGSCRVPQSWRLLANAGGEWRPVEGASEYGVAKDRYNRVTFAPVEASGLRIEADLAPKFSGGILEWRVGDTK